MLFVVVGINFNYMVDSRLLRLNMDMKTCKATRRSHITKFMKSTYLELTMKPQNEHAEV